MSSRTHAVFASYSRHDEPIVSPLVRLMRVVGARAFQDKDSIEPGQIWREVIFTAIDKATLVIVFWTKSAAASNEVYAEWMQGIRLGKTIVPALLDSTPLEPRLAVYQWLDLRPISVAAVLQDSDGQREVLIQSFEAASIARAVTQLLTHINRVG